MTEILRKMTIKACGFDVSKIKSLLEDKMQVDLLKIAGVTSSAQPGQTDKGEYVKLGGTFQAVNLDTGELFQSSTCILPNFITEPLAMALQGSGEVEFALAIGVKVNPTSVTGYEYTVKPLVEAKVSEKLGNLLEAAGFYKPLKQLKAA